MASALICAERIRLQQRANDKESAIRAAGRLLADAGCIDPAYIDSLLRRETVANTFLGHGAISSNTCAARMAVAPRQHRLPRRGAIASTMRR